jgi:FtsP/CotA-like multicopper oxidase with cupredoxin domain
MLFAEILSGEGTGMLSSLTTRVAIQVIALAFFVGTVHSAVTEYDLTIAREKISITNRVAHGMTINGNIPGPTLHFKEGDSARIHVHNKMEVETSIHWHGLLVPPDMDGVPNISFPPIAPGTTFTYEFPIRQSGTYWYHSHTSLQEQSGVYGAIVIEPAEKRLDVDREYVVVLSDWTDEDPHSVLRTLKRGSEWYAIEKGSGQSILGAARLGMLGDYFKRELQRMPPMDISDVAYDRFLANGKPETFFDAQAGETIRFRIVDGSATTYFHLEFAGSPMRIISADGLDVKPIEKKRFLIGVAETYDVLIQIPANGAYELRATAHDGSGYASVWVGSGDRHFTSDVPRPNLYHAMGHLSFKRIFALTPAGSMGMSDDKVEAGMFDKPGMMRMETMHNMKGMNHGPKHPVSEPSGMDMHGMPHSLGIHEADTSQKQNMPMKHHDTNEGGMVHSTHPESLSSIAEKNGKKYSMDFGFLATDVSSSRNLAMDGMDQKRPWPPYADLRSVVPTEFTGEKPVREIRLTLDGDMERYVWFLNNKPLSESDHILIRKGEVVRFIMINRTMMHHPMHLHGHFFRVINGQGDHAPLKHTVDVAPMSTIVIEFNANEFGDWFFHCHLLYHMKSGMARMIHYEKYEPAPEVVAVRPNLYKDSWYFWGEADILSNMTEGFLRASNTRNILTAEWEVGWEEVETTEWEGIATWDRYFNRFFTVFAGADFFGETDEMDKTRGILGFHYLLPLNVESRTWVDTDGGMRFMFDKEFALTPRFMLVGEAEYDTHKTEWEESVGLSYLVHKHFSLTARWHSDYDWGVGVQVRF